MGLHENLSLPFTSLLLSKSIFNLTSCLPVRQADLGQIKDKIRRKKSDKIPDLWLRVYYTLAVWRSEPFLSGGLRENSF